jgi:hypothetical protein
MLMESKNWGGDLWDDKKKGKGGRKVFLATRRSVPHQRVSRIHCIRQKPNSPNPALKSRHGSVRQGISQESRSHEREDRPCTDPPVPHPATRYPQVRVDYGSTSMRQEQGSDAKESHVPPTVVQAHQYDRIHISI